MFQAVYVYTPEVYATNIRATALGVHTAAARVGALLTPFNAQVCELCNGPFAHKQRCVYLSAYPVPQRLPQIMLQ